MGLIFKKWLNKEEICIWNEYYPKNWYDSKNDGKSEYCHYSTYLEQKNSQFIFRRNDFLVLQKVF